MDKNCDMMKNYIYDKNSFATASAAFVGVGASGTGLSAKQSIKTPCDITSLDKKILKEKIMANRNKINIQDYVSGTLFFVVSNFILEASIKV